MADRLPWIVLLSAAILPEATAGVESTPLAPPSSPRAAGKPNPSADPPGRTLFSRIEGPAAGFDFINRMEVDHPMNFLYHSGMTTGGVAVADFDGDGKPDIFFAGTTGPNRLYRQSGTLRFDDITATAGPIDGGDNWSAGASAADVNGDGRIDLYVCNYDRPNQLFLNTGRGPAGEPVVFTEAAKGAGLDAVDCSHSAYFADYDGDGRLDMYLLTNRLEDPNGTPKEMPVDRHPDGSVTVKPGAERYYELWRYDFDTWGTEAQGTPDRLFRNEGTGPDGTPRFRDVTASAGISGRGDGLAAVWWDYDLDGHLDLYVANDFISPDRLYRNKGDGSFVNRLAESVPHTPWFSMGADVGDVNNDLLPDLLVADMSATSHYKSKTTMGVMGGLELKRSYFDKPPQYMRNALFLNTGTERFREAAMLYGVSSTDWTWSVKFADFDLDGWQDLYFTNGISRHMNDSDKTITSDMLVGRHMFDFFRDGTVRKEKHRAFRNTAHEKFEEVSDSWGLGHVGVSYGCAFADLDRDGDLDLVEVNLEEANCIYRNDASEGGRVLIALRGTHANAFGLGASVIVRSAGGAQMRQLQPQTGYHSCNEALVHFGLGRDEVIDEIRVRWPGGGEQSITKVPAGRLYTITQPADGGAPVAGDRGPVSGAGGGREARDASGAAATLFARASVFEGVTVKDTGWEKDFERQSLIPHALSQLGPCLAWADVNGDGFDDFYFGGPAGESAQLRLGNRDGRFVARWVESFRADRACEDMGAVFLDADGDGDLDLYVASGSNEFSAGDAEHRDRLYLNNGAGGFTPAEPGAIPEEREFSSAVCAADYDRDGRTDLFVGAWCAPGDWPHAGRSRLLRNESRDGRVRFTDASASVRGLDSAGMVTSAIWSDVTGDDWADLVLAVEFGPVRIFTNSQGSLSESAAVAGLSEATGWWHGLAAADVDHDGDFDLIAGNLGLNTKYKQPKPGQPHLTYYADFDGSGQANIVEVKREGDSVFPERGRSCSSRAMPFIKEKFPTFHLFASARLDDVYPPERLASAEKFEAAEFRNGVFINRLAEKAGFVFVPFEAIAQIAPAYGIAACDFTGDGHVDLFLAQNFFGPQIENPRYDGGLGQLLAGDGKGGFTAVEPRRSGIVLAGDARSASAVDFNGDGRPDVVATVNNAPAAGFENRIDGRWLKVALAPDCSAGARVTLERSGCAVQSVEVHAGSGFLGQSPSVAWFGLAGSDQPGRVTIRWPDGTSGEVPFDGKSLLLRTARSRKAAPR